MQGVDSRLVDWRQRMLLNQPKMTPVAHRIVIVRRLQINRRAQSYSSLHKIIPECRQVAFRFWCQVCGWALRSHQRWKKQVDLPDLAMCWCMLNELSSKTPKSRTQSNGSMSTCPWWIVLSITCKLSSFARPPNQISLFFFQYSAAVFVIIAHPICECR